MEKFKEGQIVTDTKYNEVFKFKQDRDGFVVSFSPGRIRESTLKEIAEFAVSGKDCLKLESL